MTTRYILILVFISLITLICQAQWPTWYATATAEKPLCMIETYDKGYLIAGTIGNDNSYKGYGLLMKTDVNGNILWKKLFGDATSLTRFHNVIQTADGGMALSGSINSDSALFVKLNPCGEVVWSRVVLNRKDILATDIMELADSSLQTMVTNWDLGNPYESRTLFIRLNKNGNFIQLDSLPQNEFCQPNPLATEIIRTNDNNYMITSATANIGGQSLWIKTNNDMGKIWDLCWPEFYLTTLGKTLQSSNGDYYTTAGSPTGSAITNSPKIYKFDQNGIPSKVIDSLKPQIGGFVSPGAICMINDTVIVSGFAFENFNTPYNYSSYLVVTDTSGRKIQEIPLTSSKNLPIEIIKTYDDKLIALYQNENNDIAMCKFQYTNPTYYLYYSGLNTDLLFYDNLCDHPITSDTSALNPIVITDISEYPVVNTQNTELRIWPNPASTSVNVSINQVVKNGDKLTFINESGQEIKTISILNSSQHLNIDITFLSPGLYVIKHNRKGLILGYGKLVIVR
jgi:hypothetical protein